MQVYIIRHGETDWNKAKRMQGSCDIELNAYGIELAQITSEALKDINFDYIFSSPLKRAYKTAEIMRGNRKVEIKTDERLREISFGVYEGINPKELPEEFFYFFDAPEKYVAPEGAESYEELNARTGDFIENVIVPLSEAEPDARVLISGHGAMNKSLLYHFYHRQIKDMWAGIFQQNCCVNVFEVNGHDYRMIQDGVIYY